MKTIKDLPTCELIICLYLCGKFCGNRCWWHLLAVSSPRNWCISKCSGLETCRLLTQIADRWEYPELLEEDFLFLYKQIIASSLCGERKLEILDLTAMEMSPLEIVPKVSTYLFREMYSCGLNARRDPEHSLMWLVL